MAEPTKPIFDKAKLQSKLLEVIKYYLDFEGKPNMNPHFYLVKTVSPLQVRLNSGETSDELVSAINALVMVEPSTKGMIPDFLKKP